MSNILIIKHGSLGDIVQISGVLRDIREAHKDQTIFILTTIQYVELLSRCPFVDGVLIDKRLPRWNILYLFKLRKLIKNYKRSKKSSPLNQIKGILEAFKKSKGNIICLMD